MPRIVRAVQPAADLAGRLVEFDARLAGRVLSVVVEELGGAAHVARDAAHARAFLSQVVGGPRLARMTDVSGPSMTEDWKTELGDDGRLRELGLELAALLER